MIKTAGKAARRKINPTYPPLHSQVVGPSGPAQVANLMVGHSANAEGWGLQPQPSEPSSPVWVSDQLGSVVNGWRLSSHNQSPPGSPASFHA